jgi:chromosome partitioning protein
MTDDRLHDPIANESNRPGDNGGGGRLTAAQSPRGTTPWSTLSARVIALVSRKGGVGKSTSAVNLGAALALSDHTVLVVGLDTQCGVCRSLGRDPNELDGRLLEVFTDHRPLVHVAQASPLKNLFLQNDVDTFVAEIDRARNLYDTILIDCPPGLGASTQAGLLASDSFLVPVQAEELCRASVQPLLDFIDDFRSTVDPAVGPERGRVDAAPRPPALEGLFLTMANERTRMGRHVSARVEADYAESLFHASVPRTTRLSEMALRGKPAVIYDRRSAGSRAYFDLADELVARYCSNVGAEIPQPIDTDDENRRAHGEAPVGGHRLAAEMNAAPAARDGWSTSHAPTLDALEWEPAYRETESEPPDLGAPRMVSLEDLLAEEERASDERLEWGE